jgi:hypothetical protein
MRYSASWTFYVRPVLNTYGNTLACQLLLRKTCSDKLPGNRKTAQMCNRKKEGEADTWPICLVYYLALCLLWASNQVFDDSERLMKINETFFPWRNPNSSLLKMQDLCKDLFCVFPLLKQASSMMRHSKPCFSVEWTNGNADKTQSFL